MNPKDFKYRRELIMVVNVDFFYLSHRRCIALAAQHAGWDVTVIAKNTGSREEITADGVRFVDYPVYPIGLNPFKELRTLMFLIRYYKRHPNAIVHHVGLKNILLGGIAARLTRMAGVVNAVCGMGVVFSGKSKAMLRYFINRAIRYSVRCSGLHMIFQNNEDRICFMNNFKERQPNFTIIKGSGVNLHEIVPNPKKSNKKLKVIYTGRMLREKGIFDLIEVAGILRKKWEGKVEFQLCGSLYKSLGYISADELNACCDGDYIKWLGFRSDIPRLLYEADIMAFPSYYPEGIPKSLLEASAAGLPIVTTDSVGCRDMVEEGVNGFKVAPKSPAQFADKLDMLLSDADMRRRMGHASRLMAEKEYNVDNVVKKHLEIYEMLHTKYLKDERNSIGRR